MEKLFIVLAFTLFTLSVSAQETKPAKKVTSSAKTMTADEKAKCEAKCKAEGKVCTANEKKECKTEAKSCCAKKA